MKNIIFIFLVCTSTCIAQVGINTVNPMTTLDVNGAISLREGPAVVLNNGVNADIDLGTDMYSMYRITGPTAAFSINSVITPAGTNGQLLTIINSTSQEMTIVHDYTGSSTDRRISCPGNTDFSISGTNTSITLQYNASINRWMVMNYADIQTTSTSSNIVSVKGTTDISTSSDVFSDMSGMSVTFTPQTSTVYVNFGASGALGFFGSTLPKGVWAQFALINVTAGNQLVGATISLASDFAYASGNGSTVGSAYNASLSMYPITVTPGQSTTLKMQWKRAGSQPGTNSLRSFVDTNPEFSHRNLTVYY